MPHAMMADGSLHYEVYGTGLPVVLVHGFPLSAKLWESTIAGLSGQWKLIVPETRGLGRSTGAHHATMARYADDVADLLEHIGETRSVVFVGMSMGGYTAFEFFRRHRDRLRALVLVDTHPMPDTPQKAADRRATAQRVLKEGSGIVADAMMPLLFGPQAAPELLDEWQAIISGSPPEGVAAALRAMADRADSVPTLPMIDVPTQVLVGEHDAITTPDMSRAMHGAIRGARLDIILGSGHMLPVEQPKAFEDALSDFLSGLENA
ncbi:MAG: alpha/beta fold hydrolase [Phycisphaerales bacterium]|nr:alpha/beta fold hydrolase [Phycisphaerales bacterium]